MQCALVSGPTEGINNLADHLGRHMPRGAILALNIFKIILVRTLRFSLPRASASLELVMFGVYAEWSEAGVTLTGIW